MSKKVDFDKVIKELENIKFESETRTVTIKGVRNLSNSDIDTMIMYIEDIKKNGPIMYGRLMEPRGHIKEVLDRYGIKYQKKDIWG